jgi:hypothetical protein
MDETVSQPVIPRLLPVVRHWKNGRQENNYMFNLNKEIMKKLLLAVCLAFGGATLVQAQVDPASPGQAQTQDDRQQIAVSDLPDQVTAKLEGSDYAGWTVGSAFKKMDDNNQEMYIVELRQGTETKTVKFDKEGNQIDKDKKGSSNYHDESSSPEQSPSPDQSTTPEQSTAPEQSLEQPSSEPQR